MIKVIIYGCCENEPYRLILKEQNDHLWWSFRPRALEAFIPAQSWFWVSTINQAYPENDKSKFDETNDISKLI